MSVITNILIDTVRIAGFRGVKDLEVSLPRVTILIGPNNSGKTSLLKAMQLALGDYAHSLREEDFHIGVDEKRSTEILVDIRIVPADTTGKFGDDWATEFGDKIKAAANGHQFLALRTRIAPNPIKGGFDANRFTLEKWPDTTVWVTEKIKETRLTKRFDSLPFISIEAQRDIHQELRDKTSFVGKVLSGVEYNPDDINTLENLIKEVNEKALDKSEVLKNLKRHLENLNKSFQGSGNAEITPFPKKIRDLSKHFSVHFGEGSASSFSMEYHGMGTRSWASLLTVKAFIDLLAAKHAKESKPFFPILATEEPEAHLHPNAQKTLYRQLAESKGQVIISTHSPYLAAMANSIDLRSLKRSGDNIKALKLSTSLSAEDTRRLHREVLHSRGEILFSKALVLCEGETEAQVLPMIFERYFGNEAFTLGINFVGVGGSGKKYLPFFTFSKDFDIPIFVFSDGEEKTVNDLKKYYEQVFGAVDIRNCPQITVLDDTDFEGYLISSGFKGIIEAVITELDGPDAIKDWITHKHGTLERREKTKDPQCLSCKQYIYSDILRDYKSSGGDEKALMDILDSSKPKYAPAIASKLCELEKTSLPPKILDLFKSIEAGG